MDLPFTPLKISPEGLRFLKGFETFRPVVYFDQGGRATIGWGHLILPHEAFTSVSMTDADAILERDLKPVEDAINAWKFQLKQCEFDALADFVFNTGAQAFGTSTLRRCLSAGDKLSAANQLLRWDKLHDKKTGQLIESAGLLKRRVAERFLFLGQPWSPP